MKNKEFYAEKIIDIATHGNAIGVDKDTLAPCACISIDCTKCIANNGGCCNTDKFTEWANAEHTEHFEHDEVVLWRDSILDKWVPAYYACYKDGHHYVYSWGCSSLTVKDDASIPVNYVRKYDKELAWNSDYHLDCDYVTGSAILRKEQK